MGNGGAGPDRDIVLSGSGVDTGVLVPDSSLDDMELDPVCLLDGWIGAGLLGGCWKYFAEGEGG